MQRKEMGCRGRTQGCKGYKWGVQGVHGGAWWVHVGMQGTHDGAGGVPVGCMGLQRRCRGDCKGCTGGKGLWGASGLRGTHGGMHRRGAMSAQRRCRGSVGCAHGVAELCSDTTEPRGAEATFPALFRWVRVKRCPSDTLGLGFSPPQRSACSARLSLSLLNQLRGNL